MREVRTPVFCDWTINRGNPRAQILLAMFRAVQRMMGDLQKPRLISYPVAVAYLIACELVFGAEIRPRTVIGPRLRLFHVFGIVLSNQAVIGSDVTIRHHVSVGHLEHGAGAPVIGDGVEIGTGAILLGEITIGDGARIGPGALVLSSVSPGAMVMGVTARVFDPST